MEGNLIVAILFFSLALFLFTLPGFSNYVNQRYERDLKIACINAGETLVEGVYIGGETK